MSVQRHFFYILFFAFFRSLVSFYIAQKSDTFLFVSSFALTIYIHIFSGSPKTPVLCVFRGLTLKTTLGVTPSMRVFHLGTSRLRFVASRSRLELTSDASGSMSGKSRDIYIYIYIYIYRFLLDLFFYIFFCRRSERPAIGMS